MTGLPESPMPHSSFFLPVVANCTSPRLLVETAPTSSFLVDWKRVTGFLPGALLSSWPAKFWL